MKKLPACTGAVVEEHWNIVIQIPHFSFLLIKAEMLVEVKMKVFIVTFLPMLLLFCYKMFITRFFTYLFFDINISSLL